MEITSFETVNEIYMVSAEIDGYELAVDFKPNEIEELGVDPFKVTHKELLQCGEVINDWNLKEFYFPMAHELVSLAAKKYLS